VGATRTGNVPAAYNFDRHRTELGKGRPTWLAAKAAVRRWEMFDRAWIRIFPETLAIRKGSVVAVVPAHFGFFSVNLCRIVYVIDTEKPLPLFGFAYGTLRQHAESGEERFTVSWNPDDDSVRYEIAAMSKPRAIPARIGYPIARAVQRKFGRTSLESMRRAVTGVLSG